MSNPLDIEDYVAGALAATTGDLEVKPVAGGNYESTVYHWYRVYVAICVGKKTLLIWFKTSW